MVILPDPYAWSVSDHAAERYIERLAPPSEPIDLLHEPGMTTARYRVRRMLAGNMTPIGYTAGRQLKVTPDPWGLCAVFVLDQFDRHVITIYLANDREREEARFRARRIDEVERRLRSYRYVFAAPRKRYPAWLGR